MNFRFRFLAVILGLLTAFSHSKVWAADGNDVVPNGTPEVGTSAPLTLPKRETIISAEFKQMTQLFSQGLYPEVIALTNEVLAKSAVPAPAFSYGRGYARRMLSLLDEAREDLQPLGNFSAYSKWPSASALVPRIEQALAARPPQEYAIRSADRNIFRVYYYQDNEFLRAIVEALPKGYAAASRFTKTQTEEVPIFVFDAEHYAQFVALHTSIKSQAPSFWSRFVSGNSAILISESDKSGKIFLETPLVMASMMSHELTHNLVRRRLGMSKKIPNWFSEGAAESGRAVYDPTAHATNDRKMHTLMVNGTLLPLEKIVLGANFSDAVDQQKNGTQHTDAYAQVFNMTRYLGVLLKGRTMSDLLDSIRNEKDFETALKENIGLTMEEFYDSWVEALRANG